MTRNLLIWNGMASQQVSGGDIYTKKLIELSDCAFDLLLPESAKQLVSHKNGEVFVVDNKVAQGNFSLLRLYSSRILKSLILLVKLRKNYTMILASSPFLHDIIPACFCKASNRVVVLYHVIPKRKASNLSTRLRFTLARIEQKIAFIFIRKYFSIILAGNEEVKKELLKIFPGKKIIVAHAGIDTTRIDTIKTTGEKDPNLALFVGRLTIQKGIVDLVEIAKKVQAKQPGFKLKIVGDGPDRVIFENEIEKQKVNCIELLGFISETTKYEIMEKAKFFIFPSKEEGWGIALAEAMYCECIGICYELPHYRGIFGNYPEYVALNNISDMAVRILDIYNKDVNSKQKNFISQYDDKVVIQDVMSQIKAA